MTPIFLIEGTCGVGKTSLIDASAREVPGAVVFRQRQTYGPIAPLEDAGTLDSDGNERALLEVVTAIASAQLESRSVVLVDTLHFTQRLRPGVLSAEAFGRVHARVSALGAELVLLHASPTTIRERVIVGRRGTSFARYARKFGDDDDALLAYFVGEQERLRELVETACGMAHLRLDGDAPRDEVVRALVSRLPSFAARA